MVRNKRPDLMSLGNFSSRCGLSRKALRYYEQQGLLLPNYIDPETGYRHYAPTQLRLARRITALRQMGMSVEQIREINGLEAAGEPGEAVRLIHDYWENKVHALDASHRLFHQEACQVLGLESSRYRVSTRPLVPGPVLACKHRVTWQELNDWRRTGQDRLQQVIMARQLSVRGNFFLRFDGVLKTESYADVLVCIAIDSAPNICAEGDIFVWHDNARQGTSLSLPAEDFPYPRHLVAVESLHLWLAQHRKVHWGYSLRAYLGEDEHDNYELLIPYADPESDKYAHSSPDAVWPVTPEA